MLARALILATAIGVICSSGSTASTSWLSPSTTAGVALGCGASWSPLRGSRRAGCAGWSRTVTAAVAALRARVLPLWLGVFSALWTVLLVVVAFIPFAAWFPALIWLLVSSVGLLVVGLPRPAEAGAE